MVKLTPAYIRYEKSLSSYILNLIMEHCTKTIFSKKEEYMEKFKMSRGLFIKVFNLYVSLSYMTVLRSLKKNQPGDSEAKEANKSFSKKDCKRTKKSATRNL